MSRDPLRMSGSNLHSTQRLLKDLFHRVVSLEQKNRQMEILNVNMREQVKQLKLQRSKDEEKWDVLGKVCNGKFVWKITNFSEQYQKMLQNNQFVIYSHSYEYKASERLHYHYLSLSYHENLLFVKDLNPDF